LGALGYGLKKKKVLRRRGGALAPAGYSLQYA